MWAAEHGETQPSGLCVSLRGRSSDRVGRPLNAWFVLRYLALSCQVILKGKLHQFYPSKSVYRSCGVRLYVWKKVAQSLLLLQKEQRKV